MKIKLILCYLLLTVSPILAQEDSPIENRKIKERLFFGRSQHVQLQSLSGRNKVFTLLNKAYYAGYSPFHFKGFYPSLLITYEYFAFYAPCYPCKSNRQEAWSGKYFHFLNFGTAGLRISKEFCFKNKKGKEIELVIGLSIERYLFQKTFISNVNSERFSLVPFSQKNSFYSNYFFKDLYGLRIYNSSKYKVTGQLSGVLFRNDRIFYKPSLHDFKNFMMGFNVILK